MAMQGHLKSSNWDESKEGWPANGGTCRISMVFRLSKNNVCDWQLHTKVSATRKFARMQGFFDFAGCPWLQTKSKRIQWSPLFNLTACLAMAKGARSKTFKIGRDRQAKENTFSVFTAIGYPANSCTLPNHHLRKGTCCNWQLHTQVSATSRCQKAGHLWPCWLLSESRDFQESPLFKLKVIGMAIQGHLKTFKINGVRKKHQLWKFHNLQIKAHTGRCTLLQLANVRQIYPKVSATCKSARLQELSDLACCAWLHTNCEHFQGSPPFKSTVLGHCYAWKSEDSYTGPSQQSPRRSALLHSNTCQWRDSANFPFSRRHLLQRAHKNFS